MCWVVGVTRWPERRISSPFTFLYSFLLVFLFIEIETLNTHKGERREGKLCVYLGETMAFLLPQLRSLHMDDRGLNKHNAIMFLNNKTIGISWDIPMSVVVQVRCWRESVTTTSMRMGRKERKFTRPNIIQLAENILNIYGSSFHRYMDLLFTFHSSSLHSLFFPHVCPHDVDFNSTRHTGHKKFAVRLLACLDMLSMVDKVRFFLFLRRQFAAWSIYRFVFDFPPLHNIYISI